MSISFQVSKTSMIGLQHGQSALAILERGKEFQLGIAGDLETAGQETFENLGENMWDR